jgi:hypothetical protein
MVLTNKFENIIQLVVDNLNELFIPRPGESNRTADTELKWVSMEIVSALSHILERMPREFARLASLSDDKDCLEKYELVKQEYSGLWFDEKEKFRRLICDNKNLSNDMNVIWGQLLILLNFKKLVLIGIDRQTEPSLQFTEAPSPFVYSMI